MLTVDDIIWIEEYRDIKRLMEIVLSYPDPDIRLRSTIALYNIHDFSIFNHLRTALEFSSLNDERTCAAETLSNMADIYTETEDSQLVEELINSVQTLINALNDHSDNVRAMSALALGKIGDERAVEPLIKILNDPYFMARYHSAFALGNIQDIRAVNGLIKVLLDDNDYVRLVAVISLGLICDERAVDPLIKVLEDSNEDVQDQAAISLNELGKNAVEPLIKALESPNKDVQAYAASILGNIGDLKAVTPLIRTLEYPSDYTVDPHHGNPEWDVQTICASSLGDIGDPRAIEPLKMFLNNSNKFLSYQAAEALEKIYSNESESAECRIIDVKPKSKNKIKKNINDDRIIDF